MIRDDSILNPKDFMLDHLNICFVKIVMVDIWNTKFEGGVTKISSTAPVGTAGPQGGTFIMPKTVTDNIISNSGGSISKFEELLGLERGTLGTNPVRVDVSSPSGLRIPSGNELGTNTQWIPGGYTSGGIPEVIIDSPTVGTYSVKSIFN